MSRTSDHSSISRREAEVLRCLMEGLTYAEIAKRLYISDKTVQAHIHNLFERFEVRNQLQLVLTLLRRRIIALDLDELGEPVEF